MRRMENDYVTQWSIQVSANQPAKLDKFQSQCYSRCSNNVHSFPFSNADACATDRQRRRSLSQKRMKASLGAHQKHKLEKKVNIILRCDISKDLSCKEYDARLGKSNL